MFSKHFDISENPGVRIDIVTAFEVFEHLTNPLVEIEKMLKYAENIIFSTVLVPKNVTDFKDWWFEGDDPRVPHHSLWWIIYCWDYVNLAKAFNRRKKLLLSHWTHNNNSNKYPRRILKDFREIAMEYDIWNDYINDKYEKDLNTGKIERYCSGNKMKENSVILDNKLIKWEYYEKTKHPI